MRFFSTNPSEPGVIAVGQQAVGVIAIGQLALGVVAIGQFARGVFSLGQLSFGVFAVGQAAVGIGHATGMVSLGGPGFGPALRWLPGGEDPRQTERPAETPLADLRALRWEEGWLRVRITGSGDTLALRTLAGEDPGVDLGAQRDALHAAAVEGRREALVRVRAQRVLVDRGVGYRAGANDAGVTLDAERVIAWEKPLPWRFDALRSELRRSPWMLPLRVLALAASVALVSLLVVLPLLGSFGVDLVTPLGELASFAR